MWIQLIAGAFLLGEFVYHRWIEKHDAEDQPPREFRIPRTDEGAPVPLIYGRVRVKAPVLSWCHVLTLNGSGSGTAHYHFIVGVPFSDGNGLANIHGMWIGDTRVVADGGYRDAEGTLTGYTWTISGTYPRVVCSGFGYVETYRGSPTQVIANDGDTDFGGAQPAPTLLGQHMIGRGVPYSEVSGFRGYLSVYLGNVDSSSGWLNDGSAISFEASSYRDGGGYPAVGVYAQIGKDSNPINVIYDLLVSKLGKLGLPSSLIDIASFQAAAMKLYSESHGYSRAIEETGQADDIIQEILEQIDAALDEDPSTGTIKIKLIRNDYDPATIPHITKSNCEALENLSVGGWDNIINKVRVVWTDASNNYNEGSSTAHNQANAVGQDGITREKVVRMPGVTFQSLGDTLAARELSALSRPVIKMRAIVDRSFIRTLRGDAVKVTWSDPDIQDLVFRVADVDRGLLDDGKIALDLISDYFYTWRNSVPVNPHFGNQGIGDNLSLGIR